MVSDGDRSDRAEPADEAAALREEVARMRDELAQSDDHRAAAVRVLGMIAAASGDLATIFDTILANALRLCGAEMGHVYRVNGDTVTPAATQGSPPEYQEQLRARGAWRPDPRSGVAEAIRLKRPMQIDDLSEHPLYAERDASVVPMVERFGLRTLLHVPMLKGDEVIGVIVLYRCEVRPFVQRHLDVVDDFAAQAVIAIENARLLDALHAGNRDLAEALERQTATAEVLHAIASAPGEAELVLQKIVETTARLFGAASVNVRLREGDVLRVVGSGGPSGREVGERLPKATVDNDTLPGAVVFQERQIHIPDSENPEPWMKDWPGLPIARKAGARSVVGTPLKREGRAIGVMTVMRHELRPFTDKELAQLANFADQAVIAIENARLLDELRESLNNQTASAEILRTIAASPEELDKALDAIARACARLFRTGGAAIRTVQRGKLRVSGIAGEAGVDLRQRVGEEIPLTLNSLPGVTVLENRAIHVPDIQNRDPSMADWPGLPVLEAAGISTVASTPLMRRGEAIGALMVHRGELKPFTDEELAQLANFADQAVIAIENARLLDELRDALEQQTAMSEVLGTISASPGRLEPVFAAMLDKALRLSQSQYGTLLRYDGEMFEVASSIGLPAEFEAKWFREPFQFHPNSNMARMIRTKDVVHDLDLAQSPGYAERHPLVVDAVEVAGIRTALHVPLLKDKEVIGALLFWRKEVRAFEDKHIELVRNFADQAVIAIENARLLSELRESLERRTAMADVLAVISSSPGEMRPVFETMLENAVRLCDATNGSVFTVSDGVLRRRASRGILADLVGYDEIPFLPETPPARMRSTLKTVHVPDLLAELREMSALPVDNPAVASAQAVYDRGVRNVLWVPMIRDGDLVGAFVLNCSEARPFTEAQIDLVETFASQAVIAIENARLLQELRESLERRTAMAEVLALISSSPGEVQPVFEAMLDNAVRICRASEGSVFTASENVFHRVASRGLAKDLAGHDDVIARPGTPPGLMLNTLKTVHVPDLVAELETLRQFPNMVVAATAAERGARSVLWVPMTKDAVVVGAFVLMSREVRSFTDSHIALVEALASQAVIAIENTRLLEELRTARDTAERTLEELREAQASLIHAEKMASLGQLTAGIAHEIKNPLNFVNNFAGLSVELLDELKETAGPAIAALPDGDRGEVDEVMAMLAGNLEKIAEHGKRADGIVKSMLAHSRGGGGERQSVDLNALVEESLNLAYHGARAQDQNFNITMERDLDLSLAPIEVVPQDLTRVFLNLFGNGFYAANKRALETGNSEFRPTLKVSTRDGGDGNSAEIRIRDNGIGIPRELKARLFEPFFTTKPTGEGTGLGLSISYEIVTKQHGGTITVESEPGAFTEFHITIPRQHHG